MKERLTKEQLLDAARNAAKYLPAASAEIMSELATRLDVTSVALSEAMEQRGQLAIENTALLHFIKTECYVAHFEPETFSQEEVTRYVSADGYEPESHTTGAAIESLQLQTRNTLLNELIERFNEISKTCQTREFRAGAAGAAAFLDVYRQSDAEATSNG